jgi:hypothetical protein
MGGQPKPRVEQAGRRAGYDNEAVRPRVLLSFSPGDQPPLIYADLIQELEELRVDASIAQPVPGRGYLPPDDVLATVDGDLSADDAQRLVRTIAGRMKSRADSKHRPLPRGVVRVVDRASGQLLAESRFVRA